MNVIVTSGLSFRGHNNPPSLVEEVEPTPFEMSEVEIGDLYAEAKNWLDGEPVTTQSVADEISKLIDKLRAAANQADARRIAEKKPLDDAVAEIQARYNPLIEENKKANRYGKAYLAINMAKQALAPYLQKLEDEQKAAADAARKIADEKLRVAQEALRASQVADLEKRESAEALIREAEKAEAVATKAENSKAHATGGTRAIGLRSVWRAEMVDASPFAKYVWLDHRPELTEFLETLASKLVLGGKRSLPGVNVIEDRVL